MRVIQRDAVQAHRVPDRVYEPMGPFGHYEPRVVPISHDPDKFPSGATAQNGMKGLPMYECNSCRRILTENQLDSHTCEGDL